MSEVQFVRWFNRLNGLIYISCFVLLLFSDSVETILKLGFTSMVFINLAIFNKLRFWVGDLK